MNQEDLSRTAVATLNLPVFDGYPYLVVRLQPGFYHFRVIPADRAVGALRELARYQAQMNDLQACLALGPDSGLFYEPDGSESPSNRIPHGGTIVCGILESAEDFPQTHELLGREIRLESFVKKLKQTGHAFGDLTKGGHKPDPCEVERLTGRQSNGIPLGLAQCGVCGEWRGECIDPNPRLSGLLVKVHCSCENRNLCARCRQRLRDRKINANFYSKQDGNVWHVPGFCALSHRCSGGLTSRA